MIKKYPYPAGNISTSQAVELIAAVVYPDDDPIAACKRVRARIRYAREKGALPLSDSINAPDFFRWALDCKDWRALASVEGLPLSGTVGVACLSLGVMTCKAYGTAIPGDPQKLRDEYCRCETERIKLVEENDELKKRISALESEVADWQERDRTMREKRSQAGKKGGRGNSF